MKVHYGDVMEALDGLGQLIDKEAIVIFEEGEHVSMVNCTYLFEIAAMLQNKFGGRAEKVLNEWWWLAE